MLTARERAELDSWARKKIFSVPVKLLLLPLFLLRRFLREHCPVFPLTLDKFNLVLTTRCTLHCKDCCNLMAYYSHPSDFKLEDLKGDMEDLLAAVHSIGCLQLIGGEPLLFKELPQLLDFLLPQKKIKSFLIVTNGTLIPSPELLERLKHPKVKVLISNYIRHSKNLNECYRVCKESGVRVWVIGLVWQEFNFTLPKGRSREENCRVFRSCDRECHELFNGEYHLCSRSSNAVHLGMVPRDENDYVNVRMRHGGDRKKIRELQRKLYNLIYKTECLQTCDCCYGRQGDSRIIVDAEQLPPGTHLNFKGEIVKN